MGAQGSALCGSGWVEVAVITRIVLWLAKSDNADKVMLSIGSPLLAICFIGIFGS